jgi:hypothetical protein
LRALFGISLAFCLGEQVERHCEIFVGRGHCVSTRGLAPAFIENIFSAAVKRNTQRQWNLPSLADEAEHLHLHEHSIEGDFALTSGG